MKIVYVGQIILMLGMTAVVAVAVGCANKKPNPESQRVKREYQARSRIR